MAEPLVHEEGEDLTVSANPIALTRGIDRRVEAVIAEIKKLCKSTKGRQEITQVATISANNDKAVGDLIADAMEKGARTASSLFPHPARTRRLTWRP